MGRWLMFPIASPTQGPHGSAGATTARLRHASRMPRGLLRRANWRNDSGEEAKGEQRTPRWPTTTHAVRRSRHSLAILWPCDYWPSPYFGSHDESRDDPQNAHLDGVSGRWPVVLSEDPKILPMRLRAPSRSRGAPQCRQWSRSLQVLPKCLYGGEGEAGFGRSMRRPLPQ